MWEREEYKLRGGNKTNFGQLKRQHTKSSNTRYIIEPASVDVITMLPFMLIWSDSFKCFFT